MSLLGQPIMSWVALAVAVAVAAVNYRAAQARKYKQWKCCNIVGRGSRCPYCGGSQ